jgi:hypothetical protein
MLICHRNFAAVLFHINPSILTRRNEHSHKRFETFSVPSSFS